MRCHGAMGGVFQGKCGSAETHDEHNFTEAERKCPGGVFFAEADCGYAMNHEEHLLSEKPVEVELTD